MSLPVPTSRGRTRPPSDAADALGLRLPTALRGEIADESEQLPPHLDLGEQHADRPVRIDEEVGAEAAGSASCTATPNPQPMPSQNPGKKLSGVFDCSET